MAETQPVKRLRGAQSQSTVDRSALKLAGKTSVTHSKMGERKKMEKYKKIRFFERQKVVRKLKQAAKKLQQLPEADDGEREMDTLRKELNYIMHFPLDQKYISLYSQVETTDEKALVAKNKMIDEIWTRVQSGEVEDASEVELERLTASKQAIRSRLGQQNVTKSSRKEDKKVGTLLSTSVVEDMPSADLESISSKVEHQSTKESHEQVSRKSLPKLKKAKSRSFEGRVSSESPSDSTTQSRPSGSEKKKRKLVQENTVADDVAVTSVHEDNFFL